MLYPTIKQYLDALRLAEDNFDKLAAYRLVSVADGNPVMSSGNFAVVFKMQDSRDGTFHAVKCFLKDQLGRPEAYHLIADELEQVTSSYLAHIRFLERELFVDTGNGGTEYPVLVMDWVEGITLDRYLRQHLADQYALGMLAYHFAQLGAWLLTQPFAHGDLKPDNILVRPDGTLVLVDYDGMYVPAMQGQRALEVGTPDFRHPLRTDADFNEHIDDFPLASILLSLRAVAYSPDYLDRYGATDRLLLSEADYRSPEQSAFLRDEFPTPDAELNRIYALFLLALSECTLSQVSFRLFNLQKPIAPSPMPEMNTTPATDEEIDEGVKDEYGVVYSRDGKQLLKCQNGNIRDYHVREGCIVIRGWAFFCLFPRCKNLTTITLPASLRRIGDGAFEDTDIRNVISHSPFFTFSNGCLIDKQNHKLIAFLSDQEQVVLPDGLTHIGDGAFSKCENLYAIILPDDLTHIGDRAFYDCEKLTTITLPNGLTHIGSEAFESCSNLTAITLPTSLKQIGKAAFSVTRIRNVICHSPYFTFSNGCLIDIKNHKLLAFLSDLQHAILPDGLTHIGTDAFQCCVNLTAITLPSSLTHIGNGAFWGCENLTTITLPSSLTHIENHAFWGCKNLTTIILPSSLTHIGNGAFYDCEKLTTITLPTSLTHIGNTAFLGCKNLTTITLPDSLTHIGDRAFYGCSNLTTITLPDSLTYIGDNVFGRCRLLNTITLVDRLKADLRYGKDIFSAEEDYLPF